MPNVQDLLNVYQIEKRLPSTKSLATTKSLLTAKSLPITKGLVINKHLIDGNLSDMIEVKYSNSQPPSGGSIFYKIK